MACHVCCQWDAQACYPAYFLQVPVDVMFCFFVLPAFRPVGMGDDGQQVRAFGCQMSIRLDDGLHGRLPTDVQALSRLFTVVLQYAVPDVGFSQVGQVYERYSLQVDAQDEHVPCKNERRACRQAEKPDGPDGF